MLGADRMMELARDAALGKNKTEVATTPEEQEAFDRLVEQVASLPAGVALDIPTEHPPEGYLANVWGDPVSDEQIAAAAGGNAPAAPAAPAAPEASAPAGPDSTGDGAMNEAWNVQTPDGQPVTDVAGLAKALNTTQDYAVKMLHGDPALMATAPQELQDEVKGKFVPFKKGEGGKGGGDKPPEIANGSFVSWSGGKGKVDLIVTNGKVPGVSSDVVGTAKSPAARVVVYENDKATGKKIGASTHTLKRIPPLGAARPGGPKSKKSAADLVTILADHEARVAESGLPPYSVVPGLAVKTVYDRGLAAYPGPDRTALGPEDWAVGRVEHFVKVAAGEPVSHVGHDVDLLAKDHPAKPLRPETPPAGTEPVAAPPGTEPVDPPAVESPEGKSLFAQGGVLIDMAQVNADLADLLDAAKDDNQD